MELNISTGFWQLDTFCERFVPGGYQEEISWQEQLEVLSGIDGLTGFAPTYPTAPLPGDPVKLAGLLSEHGFRVADIYVDVNSEARFRHGAFCTSEQSVRRECIRLCKEAMDVAAGIPRTAVTLWPGHDGFDNSFQVDYLESWKRMVDTFQQICGHNRGVQVNLEYKLREPRQKFFIGNMGKMMMFFNEVGAPNLKGCLDTGHALQASENLAESAVLLHHYGRLGTIHNNDNYRDADSDLLVGSVAFWDNLELYYHLRQTDYRGWNEIETFLPRDNRQKGARVAVNMIRKLHELAGRLVEHEAKIRDNLTGYRFIDNMELILELLL